MVENVSSLLLLLLTPPSLYPALLVVLMHKTLSEHFVKDESDEDQQRTEKKKEQQKIMLFVSAGLLAFGSLSMSTTTLSTNRNCVLWQNIGTRNHSFLLTSFLTQTTSHPSIHRTKHRRLNKRSKPKEPANHHVIGGYAQGEEIVAIGTWET